MRTVVLEEHGEPLAVREVSEPSAPSDGVVVVGCGGVGLSAVPDRLAAMSELDTVGIEVVTEFE